MDDVTRDAEDAGRAGARGCAAASQSSHSAESGDDVIGIARRWLDEAGCAALVTLVSTWGSAPVPAGAQLAVAVDGQRVGSVSGGCVDDAVAAEAAAVVASGVSRSALFDVTDEAARCHGLPCGGRIEVFIERLSGAEGAEFLDAILSARAARAPLVVEWNLRDGTRRLFRDLDGFEAGVARRFSLGESLVVEDDARRAFYLAVVPAPRLIVVGGGEIAGALADLAPRVGFPVTRVDPRVERQETLADGETFLSEWPATALSRLGLDLGTAVVTLAHDPRLDDETLIPAVRSSAFYVGALGSRRTHEKRVARLAAAGLSEAEIARIDAPVGVSIGAKGGAEIAVSILAAIIKARRGA